MSVIQSARQLRAIGGQHISRQLGASPDAGRALALLDEMAAAPPATLDVPVAMPLALYGAGNLGRMAAEFLAEVGRDFDFIIDRNAAAVRDNPFWSGIPVYAPDDVPAHLKRDHLLLATVVTAPYVPVEAMLSELGFAHVAPFYDFAEQFRAVHSLSNGWCGTPLSSADRDAIGRVLISYADDASRAHHLQFLAWRQLREEWTFNDIVVANHNRFFIAEVMDALVTDPVFLDGGAHHGSVSLDLVRQRPGTRSIIAVEPDAANRAVLAQALAGDFSGRVSIIAEALGAVGGKARFHAGLGYASQISPIGQETVAVTTIDALEAAPDFVKLHLEGGELDALRGGRETFRQHRPIIAATVYHNADGLYETPLWLMGALDDYRILFRTHSWCGTGAVVYAIPAERPDA